MASRAHKPVPEITRSHPDVIAFAEALARAHVARDIARAREDRSSANPDIRPLQ